MLAGTPDVATAIFTYLGPGSNEGRVFHLLLSPSLLMSDCTSHGELKGPNPHSYPKKTSDPLDGGFLAHDLSGDRWLSNVLSDVIINSDSNVLIVGWDGLGDPSNPKK